MPQNCATSPASSFIPERPPSQSTVGHLPPKPSCGLRVIQKPSSRADGNVICKKRKRSMERPEQKVFNDRDRMCLAQRLRHHHDTQGTDRHARYDVLRGTSRRKEQYRSDSPSSNHRDSDRHPSHNLKSYDLRISDDNGGEKTSALPPMNNRASGESGDIVREAQHPTSQLITAESTNRFLDSVNLNNAITSNAPAKGTSITPTLQTPLQLPVSIAPDPLPLSGSPVVDVRPITTLASEPLSLSHHGHRLNYDLNLLPDDPIGPVTLLGATQSEPGAYLIVGAHYRRTGRSRAACEVIKAMLQKHAPATYTGGVVEGNKENVFLHQASTSLVELPTGFEISHIDDNTPAHKASILRPAFLLLAACRLDISRDCSSPKEKIAHANAAQDLFRALYGPSSNTSPSSRQAKTNPNIQGLGLTDRTPVLSTVNNNGPTTVSKQNPGIPTAPAATRILALEEELRITRTTNATLETRLADAKKLQERTEQSAKEAETRSRQALRLLEAERDEYRTLRRRLMETEQKLSDMEQSATGSETRVWARLRDLVCDQFASSRGL